MIDSNIYFIDLNMVYQIFSKNIWYLGKLLIVAYFLFYWLPTKIFPQEHTGKGVQKVVFNFIFMTAYIETVVTFLIFIKAFSITIFLFTLLITKAAFMKWYYHVDLLHFTENLKNSTLNWFFNLMDKTRHFKTEKRNYIFITIRDMVKNITLYRALQGFLFFSIFAYIISVLISRGLYSYSNPLSDTAQFINWVDNLQHNILYADNKTEGADFYGISIMIFFVGLFTNIDVIILFSIYPILLLLALYLSIYYVSKDYSESKYVAIFAVMMHGIIFMSPLSNIFLGKTLDTFHPGFLHFYNFSIYIPKTIDLIKHGHENGYIPYIRYISGMAYEHASVFVLLNAYLLIKTLLTKQNIYLLLYGLTLMLVFTFHGGGAITLMFISILIAVNAILFKKIDLNILKKGLLTIVISSIVGNLWILSVIKYGIPRDFGAAAPILDKLLKTDKNAQELAQKGIEAITISNITYIHIIFALLIIFAYFYSLFTKRRFINSSFILIPLGIFILYFGPNLGLPLLASQSRLAEYMFFAMTLTMTFYFFHFFYKPVKVTFKRYSRYVFLSVTYALFIFLTLSVPRWMDTKLFWKNINALEYTAISDVILKINSDNKPFSWTIVSYVQEYAKVRNKGYHINTQNFLLRYDPSSKELKIDTPKIYIFVENFPNPYSGKDEWYYRWRNGIQNDLKSWIALYSANHSNIRVYYKTNNITVYEIDNSKYVNHLKKLKRLKRLRRLKNEHL